jgi:hypothetical protein
MKKYMHNFIRMICCRLRFCRQQGDIMCFLHTTQNPHNLLIYSMLGGGKNKFSEIHIKNILFK